MTVPVLLGPNGKPISSKELQNKKAAPPALGERYGQWAGEHFSIMNLPGGGAIAFDPRQLTLSDFRQMKSHYQINSSLSILTFMMHQTEWHIECEKKEIEDHVGENMFDIWTRLVRAMSQSLWAAYSPNVLQWDNDVSGRRVVLTKIKDLIPEDCRVHWKDIKVSVPGFPNAYNNFKVYDGIDQFGTLGPIPVANSFWYPILMENGNYYGRRLLESAFQPWFFSTLLHLFANRYYERYGEPTPIGRAPYEDEIEVGGQSVKGNVLMGMIIQALRNRSTVVLPNERTQIGDETNPGFDYTLEYLESQMRGADFERYMTRLDEEMSLAMFTPILMMRTADVGSYNLGTQHTQVYQWMLNALCGDWTEYINKYIIRPMVRYNFGDRAPLARIKFMKMGKIQTDILQSVVSTLISKGAIKPDIRELGEFTGMTFEEIKVVNDTPEPAEKEEKPDPDEDDRAQAVAALVLNRVTGQVKKAFREDVFGTNEFALKMGYKRQMQEAFYRDGITTGHIARVDELYDLMDEWVASSATLGKTEFQQPEEYMRFFEAKFRKYIQVFKR